MHIINTKESRTLAEEILAEAKSESDGKVKLTGFGLFQLKTMAPRKARNPKTGETVDVPAKVKLSFRPSANVKRELQ